MDAAEAIPAGAAVLAVLTRAPASGGKSRLFASLGIAPDPALPAALLLDTLDAVAASSWTRVVVVEPSGECEAVRALVPADVAVLPQRGADLGSRMRAAMDDLFAAGARAVALVGSDLPAIDPRAIADAFTALHRDPHALVLGPAHDGGYYLIAATRTPDVFAEIAWGGVRVLEETLAAARRAGLRVHLVDACRDVDDVDDLRRLARLPAGAARTRAWIRTSGVENRLIE